MAVGGLANASAHAGMSVGVLLVGGALVLGDRTYGQWHPISSAHSTSSVDEPSAISSDGVSFFQVSPAETGDAVEKMWSVYEEIIPNALLSD